MACNNNVGVISFPSFHLVCIVRTSGPDGLVEGKRSYKKKFLFFKTNGGNTNAIRAIGWDRLACKRRSKCRDEKRNGQANVPANRFVFYLIAEYLKFCRPCSSEPVMSQ